MRLTLRTMLAYLDEVLAPTDSQELGRKIEESSFASGLVHRIRDSMRRLRLGAPKVDGKGMGLDPNTVAEYLDSTLDPAQVPDFEKVCLESDVHLAEVASCHQVLTLVLGEPANVEPALRNRIYRIGHPESLAADQAERAAGNGAAHLDSAAPDIEPASTATRAAHLQATKAAVATLRHDMQPPHRLPVTALAITLLLCFVGALAAFQFLGGGLFGRKPNQTAVNDPVSKSNSDVGTNGTKAVESPNSESDTPTKMASEIESTTEQVEVVPTEKSEMPSTAVEKSPAAPIVEAAEVAAASESPQSEPIRSTEAPGVTTPPSAAPARSPTDAPRAEVASPEPPATKPNVGRYISDDDVLARFDAAQNAWFRLTPNSPLLAGDSLLTFPTYRPQLLLSDVKVTLIGESYIVPGVPDETQGPWLTINSGRALVLPVGDKSMQINLYLAGRKGTIVFSDMAAVAGVEVSLYRTPGTDPETEPAATVVQIYAASGQVAWRDALEKETQIVVQPGQVVTFLDEAPARVYESGETPAWLEGRDVSNVDRISSVELLKNLDTEQPLSLSLHERTNFRQVDVRALACRSLCCLDDFDPALEALDNDKNHAFWSAHFDSLTKSLSRGPESAARLREALEKLVGDDAASMYRMLWGYSPEQLQNSEAKILVDALEHDRMSVRVLAYENLERITGRTQLFHPESPPAQEKSKVLKWRRNLEAGGIVYENLPKPLPDRKAVE